MKNSKANRKRMLVIILGAVLAVGAVAGIAAAVRATTSSAVMVVKASGLNYGGGYDWENSVSGMITTDAEQSIYLTDSEVVEEVMVGVGQAVHKGDVLLRYDTEAVALNLEKEKIAREKLLLDLEVARANQKTLDSITPESDDDGLLDDFDEFDEWEEEAEMYRKAKAYKTKLTEKSKPANTTGDEEEDELLGDEDNPFIFLCEGDEITITPEFISAWKKYALENDMDQLYIAIQKRDKEMKLEKGWIVDVTRLDSEIAIDLDLTTGETSYAGMNKPAKMAKLLRKILKGVPKDERAAWLAQMMDKLLVTTEKEEKRKVRGELLAATLDALTEKDRKEFAAAAALLDPDTVSVLLQSLTNKQIKGLDEDVLSGLLATLLSNMTADQVKSLDADILANLLKNLTADQLTGLPSTVLSEVLGSLSSSQLEEVLNGLSEEKRQEIMEILLRENSSDDSEQEEGRNDDGGNSDSDQGGSDSGSGSEGGSNKDGSDDSGSSSDSDQGGSGSGSGKDNDQDSDQDSGGQDSGDGGQGSGGGSQGSGSGEQGSGSSDQGSSGTDGGSGDQSSDSSNQGSSSSDGGNDASGGNNSGSSTDGNTPDDSNSDSGNSDPNADDPDQNDGNPESDSQQPENGGEEQNPDEGNGGENPGQTPSTAPSPSDDEDDYDAGDDNSGSGQKSGSSLIASDASYTSEELAQEKREVASSIKELELDLRESDLKIRKAQKAVDEGEVKANMNGVIKKVGDPKSPPKDGSAFLTLAGSDGLFVKSAIRENLLGSLGEGDKVTVTSWQDGSAYEAVIGSVSPYPDNSGMFNEDDANTYYPFTALIENKNTDFRNGDWVEVSYTASAAAALAEDEDETLYLWNAFVRDENGKKYVYLRGEDERLHKQYIQTGELSDSCYRIISGVTMDDWIAFPYSSDAEEGAKTREATVEDIYRK